MAMQDLFAAYFEGKSPAPTITEGNGKRLSHLVVHTHSGSMGATASTLEIEPQGNLAIEGYPQGQLKVTVIAPDGKRTTETVPPVPGGTPQVLAGQKPGAATVSIVSRDKKTKRVAALTVQEVKVHNDLNIEVLCTGFAAVQ